MPSSCARISYRLQPYWAKALERLLCQLSSFEGELVSRPVRGLRARDRGDNDLSCFDHLRSQRGTQSLRLVADFPPEQEPMVGVLGAKSCYFDGGI